MTTPEFFFGIQGFFMIAVVIVVIALLVKIFSPKSQETIENK